MRIRQDTTEFLYPIHSKRVAPSNTVVTILAVIKSPRAMRSPEIPHRLGWLNYWSAAAAQVLGFPDPARDAEMLSRARRTATGGWVVRLTDTPLDLDNPAHLDALMGAYERFPEIGGRKGARSGRKRSEDL